MHVRLYNRAGILRFWRINYRLHDKYLIVDGARYVLGGRNISSHSLGDYLASADIDRDLLVCPGPEPGSPVPGRSAHELRAYFEASFGERCARPFAPRLPRRAGRATAHATARLERLRADHPELGDPAGFLAHGLVPAEKIELVSNGTNPGNKQPAILRRVSELASSGRDVFVQTPYAVLDRSMFGFRPRAARPGHRVSMLTNAPELGANLFGCGEYLLHWRRLASTGARIYEWAHGPSIHAKLMLVDDDLSVVGSYNLDLRSTYLDTELMLVMKSRELNRSIRARLADMRHDCIAVRARALTRFDNSRRILKRVRRSSEARVQTALRVLCIRAKMALSRTSGILLAPFRYLM